MQIVICYLLKLKQEEIVQQIGKSLRTVKSRMIEMQEKGLIERKNKEVYIQKIDFYF